MKTRLKVTAKGQVTLRREVLDHLGVAPGDQVAVNTLPDGRVELRAAKRTGSIEDFIGLLPNKGISLSIEEMNDVIADGWAGKIK